MKRTKEKFKKILSFLLNPRFLLCFGIAWIITNGWSYIALGLGSYYDLNWLSAIGGTYLAFLWLPITPEKIVTVFIAIGLLKLLFPQDKKTLAVLTAMYDSVKRKHREKKDQKNKETAKSPKTK